MSGENQKEQRASLGVSGMAVAVAVPTMASSATAPSCSLGEEFRERPPIAGSLS